MLVKSPRNITRAVLAKEKEANLVMVMAGKKLSTSILAMLLITTSLLLVGVEAGSNFADSLAECSAVQELNICLREVVMKMVAVVIAMIVVMMMAMVLVRTKETVMSEKNVWHKSLSRTSFRHSRCSASVANWCH